jgi:hypothetical protein
MKSPWKFQPYGQSGIPVSELFPHVATCVDDLCVVRSMVGDGVDHGAALLQLHTGVFSFRRPSMGSWALYGLGTENQNLPGFITIKPSLGHGGQNNWSSSFLPGEYQGTPIGNSGMKVEEIEKEPMPFLIPQGLTHENQRFELDMLQKMNRRHAETNEHDPDLEARIGALELAFRMQVKAPEAFDGSVCWRDGSRNGACVLCSAPIATNGTSIPICSGCTPRMPPKWTSRSRAF